MRIATDMRLFGFPVVFDTTMDKNVVCLENAKGDRICITIEKPEALDAVARTAGRVTGGPSA